MTERLPRVVLGVRKTTPTDEELKITVFSLSFVLHLINEVLCIIRDSLALLAFVTLSRVRFVTPLYHFCTRDGNFFQEKKSSPIFF